MTRAIPSLIIGWGMRRSNYGWTLLSGTTWKAWPTLLSKFHIYATDMLWSKSIVEKLAGNNTDTVCVCFFRGSGGVSREPKKLKFGTNRHAKHQNLGRLRRSAWLAYKPISTKGIDNDFIVAEDQYLKSCPFIPALPYERYMTRKGLWWYPCGWVDAYDDPHNQCMHMQGTMLGWHTGRRDRSRQAFFQP